MLFHCYKAKHTCHPNQVPSTKEVSSSKPLSSSNRRCMRSCVQIHYYHQQVGTMSKCHTGESRCSGWLTEPFIPSCLLIYTWIYLSQVMSLAMLKNTRERLLIQGRTVIVISEGAGGQQVPSQVRTEYSLVQQRPWQIADLLRTIDSYVTHQLCRAVYHRWWPWLTHRLNRLVVTETRRGTHLHLQAQRSRSTWCGSRDNDLHDHSRACALALPRNHRYALSMLPSLLGFLCL